MSGKNLLRKNFSEHHFNAIEKTHIGNDVWIGSGVLIKSGINIGDGAIIGAGSIVTHDVPPYEIWAGSPARLIRKRFDDETISKLLEIKWWDWEDKKIKRYSDFFDSPQRLFDELK